MTAKDCDLHDRALTSAMRQIHVIVLLCVMVLFGSASTSTIFSHQPKRIEIRGIYGSPEPFWKKNLRLDQLGVNAIFLHSGSINDELMKRAKSQGLKVFAEFATLNGKNYVDKHPEAWAIGKNGDRVEAATWFMGVCPTEPGFRQHRFAELRALLRKFPVDGVWMDYLHWHAQFEDPEPILPETCFCENCLSTFEAATQFNVPEGTIAKKAEWILTNKDYEWRNWRCSVIAGWARDFKRILKEEKPGALLGVYHCPWDDNDFKGARRYNLGLDYDSLKGIVDVFSPMVYHGRMGRSPEWVKENIEWFSQRLDLKDGAFPKVWPIVQCYNDPKTISASEFEKVLRYGTAAQSSGVMMFTSSAVAEDEGNIEAMRKVYSE